MFVRGMQLRLHYYYQYPPDVVVVMFVVTFLSMIMLRNMEIVSNDGDDD